jgi:GNAT superfamily N-acetyltransferase
MEAEAAGCRRSAAAVGGSGVPLDLRPARESDREQWAELYRGYREFYRQAPDDAAVDTVWAWLLDPERDLHALVADRDGTLVGLAHWRHFDRPLKAQTGVYLDDLFVDPESRGGGTGRALIAEVRRIAEDHGAGTVRWITAADNVTARRLYDSVATATEYVTYDIPL